MSELNKIIENRISGISTDRQWYVIYTKPRQEVFARDHLNRQSFLTYLPLLEITKRQKGELVTRVEPFFPRYLFISLDKSHDNWSPIRSTRGVSSLVRFDGIPKPVPDSLIQLLRDNENSQQLQTISPKSWNKGDSVEIEQGPFAGYRCIFQESRGIDRVSVLLDIVGKQTRAMLHKDDLQIPQFA